MLTPALYGLLIQAVICSFAAAWLAGKKGRNDLAWGVLGFCFGIVAVLAVGLAPGTGEDPRRRPCPQCAESIPNAAHRCRFCGHELTDAEMRCAQPAASGWKELSEKSQMALIVSGIALVVTFTVLLMAGIFAQSRPSVFHGLQPDAVSPGKGHP